MKRKIYENTEQNSCCLRRWHGHVRFEILFLSILIYWTQFIILLQCAKLFLLLKNFIITINLYYVALFEIYWVFSLQLKWP